MKTKRTGNLTFSTRSAVAALAVFCCTACAFADIDYSTYIQLKKDFSSAAGVPYPTSTYWTPAGAMAYGNKYIIPSGRSLTTSTYKDETRNMIGGTWPMDELAIQGTFAVTANGGRQNVAVTEHLALLPGGTIMMKSAYGTVKGDTLDIRGTAENPSVIGYDYATASDKSSYYAILDIAFTGAADNVVRFVYTVANSNYSIFQRAFRVTKGFDDFLGTVIVDGENTWLRPETSATTFDIPGTLWITNGASVYVATVSPTFGSLVMAGDATLQLASGKAVTVTNSFEIEEGAKITLEGAGAFMNDYSTGVSHSPMEITFLSVCGAANAAGVDRTALADAVKAGSVGFVYGGGIPRLKMVESARADGGVDFKLTHEPFVAQIKNSASASGPYGFEQYDTYLSDGQAISPDLDYVTQRDRAVYFDSPYVFPGRSWTIAGGSGTVGFYSGDQLTVADLRLLDGAWFRQMSKNINAFLYGAAVLYGTVNFRISGSNTFKVESVLSGVGDIVVSLDVYKCAEKGSAYRGRLELAGANSAWTGRTLVGCGRSASANEGLTNLTLRAASAANLGGARDAFTFDAVKIADTCTLAITDTTTFDAANRGWCLMDGSTVDIAANKTVTVNETVTFGGASVKTGSGTLVLGGGAKFYDDENDAASDTPNGASFRIAAGRLGVTSATALQGVGVTFAAGTKLVAYPDTDGLSLSSAPTFEGGTLPVEIVVPDSDSFSSGTVNLLTLPSSVPFDAASLSVSRPKGCRLGAVTAKTVGDSTVYCATLSKAALVVTIQ